MMEKDLSDILPTLLVYALLTLLANVVFSEFISGVITVIIVKYSQELPVIVMKNSFKNPHRNSLQMSRFAGSKSHPLSES